MATSSGKNDILGKVRFNRKTKEALNMGERYEPTASGIQYLDGIAKELEARGKAYEKMLEGFRLAGGAGSVEDGILSVRLPGASARVHFGEDDKPNRIELDVSAGSKGQLIQLSNAITAVFGASKNAESIQMAKELHAYLENDGLLSGLNTLVNGTILNDPVLTALGLSPDEPDNKGI